MSQENITDSLKSWSKLDRYSKWIFHLYEKYIGKNVLDIGGGIGTALSFYIDRVERLITTELFDNQVDLMNERFKDYPYFKAIKADIVTDDFSMYNKFDTIILINVLEHIEDDKRAILRMKELLLDGGKIIVCVPACSRLYCYMDKNVGHYRRYDKGILKKLATEAGLEVLEDKYQNFLGIVPYWLKGRLKGNDKSSFSDTIGEGESKIYALATWLLEPVEKFVRPPVGISEFIILKK